MLVKPMNTHSKPSSHFHRIWPPWMQPIQAQPIGSIKSWAVQTQHQRLQNFGVHAKSEVFKTSGTTPSQVGTLAQFSNDTFNSSQFNTLPAKRQPKAGLGRHSVKELKTSECAPSPKFSKLRRHAKPSWDFCKICMQHIQPISD